jgi:hypothetical protein
MTRALSHWRFASGAWRFWVAGICYDARLTAVVRRIRRGQVETRYKDFHGWMRLNSMTTVREARRTVEELWFGKAVRRGH